MKTISNHSLSLVDISIKMQCALFSEFDVKKGPALLAQYPAEFIDNYEFSAYSELLIPRVELCGKLISFRIRADSLILGFPVVIFSDKYERQKLEYNFAIAVNRSNKAFEQLVRKVNITLATLELENDFLSKPKDWPFRLCQEVYTQMLDTNSCFIELDPFNTLIFEVFEEPSPYFEIRDSDVPIQLKELSPAEDCDLAVAKVLPFIKQEITIKDLAFKSQVHESLVRLIISELLKKGFVEIQDLFKYANTYRVTSNFSRLYSNPTLIATKVSEGVDLVEFYNRINWRKLDEWLQMNPEVLRSTELKKFIRLGQSLGILKSVNTTI